MKKIFLIGLLSILCINLLGCNPKTNEDSVILPPTNDDLLKLAAEALPCEEGVTFANFAMLGTGVSKQGNLMYYGVDEVLGFLLNEEGNGLIKTCYRIAPIAMEISQSDKGFKLVNAENAEIDTDFLIEDYNPEFDGGKLDSAVEVIFSPTAFATWQQRNYWEYFLDYNDADRKTFDERAMEYFGIRQEETEEFISYYDNGNFREVGTYIDGMKEGTWITYDEGGNVIEVNKYKNGELVQNEENTNILSVKEEDILSTDELKKLCEKVLIGTPNTTVTRTDEMLFINTYGFKGITKSNGLPNNSPVYCNVTHDGVVLDAAFYLDEGETIEELHKKLDYTPGGIYPNLKEYYGFVGNIVLGNMYQTTYITGKNTMYFDNSRGIAFKLGAEFNGGLIREIDTDEGGYPHSEIILLVKGEENEENRTGINGFREVYTIRVDSKTNLENFNINPDLANAIGENNEYYFIGGGIDTNTHFSDLIIFDVEEY